MAKKEAFLWLIIICFCTASAVASPRIRSISFEGNQVSKKPLLLREMYLKIGDQLDQQLLDQSIQAIMDLGLFESVTYYLAEDYTDLNDDEDVIDLVILLEEKYYLLILPRARVDEEELHLGIQLRWDNVWGLNHKLRLLFEDRGTTAGVSEERQRFQYYYPNVYGSNYDIDFQLVNINDVDENEIDGAINRQDKMLGVAVLKWLNRTGKRRGWFAGSGIDLHRRDNEVISGSFADENLDAMVLKFRTGFTDVHEYSYNRGGREFGYDLEVSDEVFGSDSEFVSHLMYYRSYYRFDSRPDENLNVQTLLGYSTDDVLGDAAYTLGSSQNLRGYENGVFEGNTLLLVNMEYLKPRQAILHYVICILWT